MDRARVICPSISLTAHVTGVTILGLALLVLPGRLPTTSTPVPGGTSLGPLVDLGRARGGGTGRRAIPRVTPPARPLPAIVPPIPLDPTLERGGFGIAGFPDGNGGAGPAVGTCLSDCGSGPAVGSDVGASVPALEKQMRQPIRIKGGDLRPPVKVHHVAPVYPAIAVASRIEGQVALECVIDEQGRVTSVAVVRGHPLFDAAAVAAVRQWRYRPTLLNGQEVSVLLEVSVDFRLR